MTSGPKRSVNPVVPLLLAGCAMYVLIVAYVPRFTSISPLFCPTRRFLGLHCPTCGMTRALACLARLDLVGALQFHPLVCVVAPFLAALLGDTLLRSVGHRGIFTVVQRPLERWGWAVFLAGFGLVFAVRMASWLVSGLNPNGWLIPPTTFPP